MIGPAPPGRTNTNKSEKASWACGAPFKLGCVAHGETISVRCGRWRTCRGCALWKQWQLTQRFTAGIEKTPSPFVPLFFTLTFPADQAPTEDDAHTAWRSLVARLRYRDRLGAYGWVLQRTKRGTLHFHGIAHMVRWPQDDGLAEWRMLLEASGFGIQNRLEPANAARARYCARYISTGLATLAPLRRAYGFSRDFPLSHYDEERLRVARVGAEIGMRPECEWLPGYLI